MWVPAGVGTAKNVEGMLTILAAEGGRMEGNDGTEPPKRSGPAIAGWPNSAVGTPHITTPLLSITSITSIPHRDFSSAALIYTIVWALVRCL
jgi:hypothetical protein